MRICIFIYFYIYFYIDIYKLDKLKDYFLESRRKEKKIGILSQCWQTHFKFVFGLIRLKSVRFGFCHQTHLRFVFDLISYGSVCQHFGFHLLVTFVEDTDFYYSVLFFEFNCQPMYIFLIYCYGLNLALPKFIHSVDIICDLAMENIFLMNTLKVWIWRFLFANISLKIWFPVFLDSALQLLILRKFKNKKWLHCNFFQNL